MKTKKPLILSLTLLLASCGSAATALISGTNGDSIVAANSSKTPLSATNFSFETELKGLKEKLRIDSQSNNTSISIYNDNEFVSVKTENANHASSYHTYQFVEEGVIEKMLTQNNEIKSNEYSNADYFKNPFAALNADDATIDGTKVTYLASSLSDEAKEAFAFYLFGYNDLEIINFSFSFESVSFVFSDDGNSFEAKGSIEEANEVPEEDSKKVEIKASGSFSYGTNVQAMEHIVVSKAKEETDNDSLWKAIILLQENNYTLQMLENGEGKTITSTSNFYSNGEQAYYYDEANKTINTYSFQESGKWKLIKTTSAEEGKTISEQLNMPSFSISEDCFTLKKSSDEQKVYDLKNGIIFDETCLCGFEAFDMLDGQIKVTVGLDSTIFSYKVDDGEEETTYEYVFTNVGTTKSNFNESEVITPSTLEMELGDNYQGLADKYGETFVEKFPVIDNLKAEGWTYVEDDEERGDYLCAPTSYTDYVGLILDGLKSSFALLKAGYHFKVTGFYNDTLLDAYRITIVPSFINDEDSGYKHLIFKLSKTALD